MDEMAASPYSAWCAILIRREAGRIPVFATPCFSEFPRSLQRPINRGPGWYGFQPGLASILSDEADARDPAKLPLEMEHHREI